MWCKYEQNRTKAIKVIEKKTLNVDRRKKFSDMLKIVYPPKTPFCRGYNNKAALNIQRRFRLMHHTVIFSWRPDSIDTLGPWGLNVVSRRLLCGSDVRNPHWPNATLLIGSMWNPHVGSMSGPRDHMSVPRRANFCEIYIIYFNFVVFQSFFSSLWNAAQHLLWRC